MLALALLQFAICTILRLSWDALGLTAVYLMAVALLATLGG